MPEVYYIPGHVVCKKVQYFYEISYLTRSVLLSLGPVTLELPFLLTSPVQWQDTESSMG